MGIEWKPCDSMPGKFNNVELVRQLLDEFTASEAHFAEVTPWREDISACRAAIASHARHRERLDRTLPVILTAIRGDRIYLMKRPEFGKDEHHWWNDIEEKGDA